MSERTEQPTPRRLEKARDEGQHPRSRILTAALPTLGAAVGLSLVGRETWAGIGAWARLAFSGAGTPRALTERGLELLAVASAPAFCCAFAGAAAGGLLQTGLQLNLKLLAPKAERLDWAAGFKRVATLKALPEAARPALVIIALLALGTSAVGEALERARAVSRPDGAAVFLNALAPLGDALGNAAAVLVCFAVADLLLARWLHARSLRMSRDEVKQEHKQQEGDPRAKAKRKALHRQLALAGPARSVAKATVVVVNPTHLAVALRYAPEECPSPYVVARGREEEAFEIRKAARAMRVPIVRDIPLARGLIHCEPGDEIPEELFLAAAAILKSVLPPSLPGAKP